MLVFSASDNMKRPFNLLLFRLVYSIIAGAAVNVTEAHRERPLHWAANWGNSKTVQLLLQKGEFSFLV